MSWKIYSNAILSCLLVLSFFTFDISWAKEYVSKEGAFSINVPNGWVATRENTKLWFYLQSDGQDEKKVQHAFSIDASKRLDYKRGIMNGEETPSDIKEGDLLDYYLNTSIAYKKAGMGMSPIISQKKIIIDGRPAFRIDSMVDLRSMGGSLGYLSEMMCITRDYIYRITMSSPDKQGLLLANKILDTIKFKG